MEEIRSIVVPVDFEQHTDRLIEFAIHIGRKFDARLKLIHVVEFPYTWGDSEYPSLALFTAEVDEHTRQEMAQLVAKLQKDYAACEGKILQGYTADAIVEYAEHEKADLIIIGTHGRRGLQKFWLGSVAERVIKQSPCPTLTCNPYS